MTPGEEKQSGLVPAQSATLARVGTQFLAARGRTELRRREEAEEWLRKGLELQQGAPDDPRGRAPVNPYARASPAINKTPDAVPPPPTPTRSCSLHRLQTAAEYIEQLLAGNDPQAAAKSLGMTPDCFEMPRRGATKPHNIICGFTKSYMDRPITAANDEAQRIS
jgi:hypothetical protein